MYTCRIHMGYIGIHIKIRNLEPYLFLLRLPLGALGRLLRHLLSSLSTSLLLLLGLGLGHGWPDRCAALDDASMHSPKPPSDTCTTCIPHVSCMYSWCIPHVSWLPLKIHVSMHVSRMYPACLLHIRYISLWMHLRYMYFMNMYPWYMTLLLIPVPYISHVSWAQIGWSPLQIHVSRMYLVSERYVPLWIHSKGMYFRMYPVCIPHVSWFCISVYLIVSWWRVQDTCILT